MGDGDACPACSSTAARVAARQDPYVYVECAECGLVRLADPPTPDELRALYDRAYFIGGATGGYPDYVRDEALHRRNARARLELLRAAVGGRRGTLIDVGCAHGFFCDTARAAGWLAIGVDISTDAARYARERLGLSVFPSLGDLPPAYRAVDAATFFQSLEHLPRPDAALREARARLRPGGVLLIETWDRDSWIARLAGEHWQQFTPPSVLFVFDRRSLATLLSQANFRLRSITRTSKLVSVGHVTALLAGKYPRLFGRAARMVNRRRLGKVAVRYRGGDLVTVVAEAE